MASKLWWNSFMLYLTIALFIVGITIMGLSLTKYPRKMWNRVKPKNSLSRDGQVGLSGRRLSMTGEGDYRTNAGSMREPLPTKFESMVKQSESMLKQRTKELNKVIDYISLYEAAPKKVSKHRSQSVIKTYEDMKRAVALKRKLVKDALQDVELDRRNLYEERNKLREPSVESED